MSTICSHRSRSTHRRTVSRRTKRQGPEPVDKLLFLRHRAKENMKLGKNSAKK